MSTTTSAQDLLMNVPEKLLMRDRCPDLMSDTLSLPLLSVSRLIAGTEFVRQPPLCAASLVEPSAARAKPECPLCGFMHTYHTMPCQTIPLRKQSIWYPFLKLAQIPSAPHSRASRNQSIWPQCTLSFMSHHTPKRLPNHWLLTKTMPLGRRTNRFSRSSKRV